MEYDDSFYVKISDLRGRDLDRVAKVFGVRRNADEPDTELQTRLTQETERQRFAAILKG